MNIQDNSRTFLQKIAISSTKFQDTKKARIFPGLPGLPGQSEFPGTLHSMGYIYGYFHIKISFKFLCKISFNTHQ